MALNDFFDYQIDLKERPDRPIPSGRISRPQALIIGLGLLVAGLVFASFAGTLSFGVSVALVMTILLYDGVYKDHWFFGPLTMASCRYFNFLMGLSLAPFTGWWAIPLITGIYIFGVTVLSQKEAVGGKAVATIAGSALAVGVVPVIYYFNYLSNILPLFSGFILAVVFATVLSTRILSLLKTNTPADYQQTMKQLLMSLIILDIIIASGAAPIWITCTLLLLYIPAIYSVRLFKIT